MLDVWSRTQPKYRRRAILLLLVDGALFFGLGCFTFWLRKGTLPFLVGEYWHTLWECFNPRAQPQITLIDFLIDPINVQQAPMQIIVLGLLMASLVSIPILVAMLYRLPFAFLFIVIVAFVAMLPWLALTVTVSCILTTLRPLRFGFRYATALIALIPAVLYFFNATRNPNLASFYTTPIESAALYAPWALAILASCLLMGLVLVIARLVNYRPGALAPVMAVMFAVPVLLFEAHVGRDELYYRLLERDCGPYSQSHFRDRNEAALVREIVAWMRKHGQSQSQDDYVMEEKVRSAWRDRSDLLNGIIDQVTCMFLAQRDQAIRQCEQFLEDYPRSRYLPNVLYLQGRLMDMRIDVEALRRDAVLQFYVDFPSSASDAVWTTLHQTFPDSPTAAPALYRSAQLAARAGRIDEAIALADRIVSEFPQTQPAVPIRTGVIGGLSRGPSAATLDIRIDEVVRRARKFRELLTHNREPDIADPPDIPSDAPLVAFLRCDPRSGFYTRNLDEIRAKYPRSRLRDRLILEKLLRERSASLKIRAIEEFIRVFGGDPEADALPEAQYRLGEAYLRDSRPEDAVEAFRAVVAQYPRSPWVDDARMQLAELASLESRRAAR